MLTLRDAAQAALEALEQLQGGCTDSDDGTVEAVTVWCPEIIDTLRAALAEPEEEQRPVAWQHLDDGTVLMPIRPPLLSENRWRPLFAHPHPAPARVPMTDMRIVRMRDAMLAEHGEPLSCIDFARAVERHHGIGGK